MLAKGTPAYFYKDGEKVKGTVDHYDEIHDVCVLRLSNGRVASVASEDVYEDGDEPERFQGFRIDYEREEPERHDEPAHHDEPLPENRKAQIKKIATGIGVAAVAIFLAFAVTRHKPEPVPEKPKPEALVIIERMNERNLKMAKPSEVPLVESCSALKTLEKENAKDWESLQKIRNR